MLGGTFVSEVSSSHSPKCSDAGSGISVCPLPINLSDGDCRLTRGSTVRVETEHLGNADAYRVTREIPLPYRRIEHDSDSDEPLQRTKSSSSARGFSVHLAKLRKRLVDEGDGADPTDAATTPKTGYKQRPYEAWRPNDQSSRNEV